MTTRAEWESLADRCESAEKGSRELDSELHIRFVASPHGNDATSCRGCGCAKNYTTSLDAALSQVPEGWKVSLDQDEGRWTADLYKGSFCHETDAKTAPLAVCAAICRARAAEAEG